MIKLIEAALPVWFFINTKTNYRKIPMIKIIPLSDIHNEFEPYIIPKTGQERDIYLVLAGDIGLFRDRETYIDFIADCSRRFKKVIWVPGNHEYYSGDFYTSFDKAIKDIKHLKNVLLLNRDVYTVTEHNVSFICNTLWTDINNNDPMSATHARQFMSDYRVIQGKYNELMPEETYEYHVKAKEWLFNETQKQKEKGNKVVVVTHHGPSCLSIDNNYRDGLLRPMYISDLYDDIALHEPDLWIHGHVHVSNFYTINKTRVISNPKGYPDELNKNFNPNMILEL